MIEAAVAAAQVAGSVIRAAAADPALLQVRQKRLNDFVTQADVAAEQAIVRSLLSAFPGHAVRAEESPQAHGTGDADHVWIVDPLDGTNNFVHGYPVCAVSIALVVRGRIEHGVVLDVHRGEIFRASLGQGAFCNGQRLHVGSRTTLADSLIASNGPYRAGPGFARAMQLLGHVMEHSAALRRSGSAALDLAYVAAGRCDGFFDRGLKAWDTAAGGLLVTEAGGRVGSFGGGADFLESGECLAANPALFAALATLMAQFARLPSPGVADNFAVQP